MTINIQTLHPNSKTLASRIVDKKHQGGGTLQTSSLDDIQKRFLRRNEISYSLNPNTQHWEIQTN